MQSLSRWFIKSALICLVLGVLAHVSTALAAAGFLLPLWWLRTGPTATHLITVGWLTQLIFGVAHWFFPNVSKENPRGNEKLGWFAFVSLNLGLALRVVGEPMLARTGDPIWGIMIAVSATLQWFAVLAYARMILPRIKPPRKRKGKRAKPLASYNPDTQPSAGNV